MLVLRFQYTLVALGKKSSCVPATCGRKLPELHPRLAGKGQSQPVTNGADVRSLNTDLTFETFVAAQSSTAYQLQMPVQKGPPDICTVYACA